MCKGEGSQWLKSDEPIMRIVAKMLEVIVTKLPITEHKTMLLHRLRQVTSVLTSSSLSSSRLFVNRKHCR